MINIKDLTGKSFVIKDNGITYKPEMININLDKSGVVGVSANFNEDTASQLIKDLGTRTHHSPPMIMVNFILDNDQDEILIVEE